MSDHTENDLPSWVEILDRGPIAVDEDTDPDRLSCELAVRLKALLDHHNGLKPSAKGWRDLALALALQYEPAFQLETPVDRTGRSGIGGRPGGWSSFILRSRMKAEMQKGMSQGAAAKVVAKELGIAVGTAMNAFSRKSQNPDAMRRWKYEWVADRAIKAAAERLSQE